MGENNDFLQKSGLKTPILAATVLDHPTSKWTGTHNFKDIANFHRCFKKSGTLSSKWAMGKASKFNIGRMKIVWIFFWCGHEKMLKIDFFHKTPIPRNLLKEKNIRARSMWNLTSWRFRKCGTCWTCEVLNGSYRPSKMDESEKTGPSSKIRGVKKKRHGHNFEFWALPRNQRGTNHIGPTLIPYQSPKLNIVAVSFFFDASSP